MNSNIQSRLYSLAWFYACIFTGFGSIKLFSNNDKIIEKYGEPAIIENINDEKWYYYAGSSTQPTRIVKVKDGEIRAVAFNFLNILITTPSNKYSFSIPIVTQIKAIKGDMRMLLDNIKTSGSFSILPESEKLAVLKYMVRLFDDFKAEKVLLPYDHSILKYFIPVEDGSRADVDILDRIKTLLATIPDDLEKVKK